MNLSYHRDGGRLNKKWRQHYDYQRNVKLDDDGNYDGNGNEDENDWKNGFYRLPHQQNGFIEIRERCNNNNNNIFSWLQEREFSAVYSSQNNCPNHHR